MTAYTVDLSSVATMTAQQFFTLCRTNPDIKFERSATGELIIMSPTGGETGNRNFEIGADFLRFGIARRSWVSCLILRLVFNCQKAVIAHLIFPGFAKIDGTP